MEPPEGGAPMRVLAKDTSKIVELMLAGYKQVDPPADVKQAFAPLPPAPKEVAT